MIQYGRKLKNTRGNRNLVLKSKSGFEIEIENVNRNRKMKIEIVWAFENLILKTKNG